MNFLNDYKIEKIIDECVAEKENFYTGLVGQKQQKRSDKWAINEIKKRFLVVTCLRWLLGNNFF